ncbi:unnamed protein product [Adineta steineri]|uniref:Uncharacterized protein n=1 Tax=Adineta steineri TaxID=433720 RepID=A0A818JTA6_9BILA|nr:unnamed protein product [Adineta steineri]CAF1013276.1 unnamed protein product [Adineta steineri]CAF3543781.1 unnamed protein product [Adineta steineri]CAF3792869.1 unnamed protein product [Adineta steineri]
MRDLSNQTKPFNNVPNEAFLTFVDSQRSYIILLEHLIDSVHQFSTRHIIVYGIDVDLDIDIKKYPRLIIRRLNRTGCSHSIYFCKIYAIVESKLDYGIHLDADSLVNWNIDILFDVVHRWPYDYPLAPRHPGSQLNYNSFLKLFKLEFKDRTTPYVHAQFSWNYRVYPFFEKALRLMQNRQFLGANYDESGINILLWKAKATYTLCKVDPHYSYVSDYISQKTTCGKQCLNAFFIVHGLRDKKEMRNILKQIKNHTGLPYIQTNTEGFHYLNETNYTCCHPDSKPSSIHPLICEYPPRNTSY